MTRDDIYDHLAQVYLGKRNEAAYKKKKQFSAWLWMNIALTVIIFASSFYGLTAFLTQHNSLLKSRVIYPLHKGPIRVEFNFHTPVPPTQSFALSLKDVNVDKYSQIKFSIRAQEEGSPGILKVVLHNKKGEEASYYIQGVDLKWREYSIPLEEFHQITDWHSLTDLNFVLESWNLDKTKGVILIDEVRFSS